MPDRRPVLSAARSRLVADAFHASRAQGHRILGACLARLPHCTTAAAASGGAAAERGGGQPVSSAEARRIHGAQYGDSSPWQGVRRIGLYLTQRRRGRRAAADGSVAVVALNSRRFASVAAGVSIRGYIDTLATPLPGAAATPRLRESLRSARAVVVCDPVLCSPLWKHATDLWREDVFIVDGAFLLFAAITDVRAACRLVLTSWRHLRSRAARRGHLRSAVAASVLAEGYDTVLGDRRRLRAALFTTNSFQVEVLRAYLLCRDDCDEVVEVLHGVPSYEYQEYMATVLAAVDRRHAQSFLAQVPLALPPPFDRLHGDVAVNGYVNHYFCSRRESAAARLQTIRREWAALASGGEYDRRPLVIAFTGATSHDPDFLRSDAFAVERFLIGAIRRSLRRAGHSFVIVYTPHPLHGIGRVASEPFFQAEDVRLHGDTIFSWFVADVCIGLYSSALFEARHCGLPTFTPLTYADDVYPPALLDLLTHPDADGDLEEALDRFLAAAASAPRDDLFLRAAERLSRLVSTADDTPRTAVGEAVEVCATA